MAEAENLAQGGIEQHSSTQVSELQRALDEAAARSFNNAPLNLQQRARTPANGNFDVSAGHAIDTPNGRIGGLGVGSYRNRRGPRKGVRERDGHARRWLARAPAVRLGAH